MGYVEVPDGQPQFVVPTYDWDDFRSFLTGFRIVISNDEPIYLPNMINIAMKYSDDPVRDAWRDHTRLINAILAGKFNGLQYGVGPIEKRTLYNGRQLLDILINGKIFHEGQDKAADVKNLGETDRENHVFVVLNEVIAPVMRFSAALRNLIFWLQILPESDFPPPDRRE